MANHIVGNGINVLQTTIGNRRFRRAPGLTNPWLDAGTPFLFLQLQLRSNKIFDSVR